MNKNTRIAKFGKELKKKRIDCDMSRVELAKISGVKFTTIKRIEQGLTDPRLETVIRIGKALGESEFLVKF